MYKTTKRLRCVLATVLLKIVRILFVVDINSNVMKLKLQKWPLCRCPRCWTCMSAKGAVLVLSLSQPLVKRSEVGWRLIQLRLFCFRIWKFDLPHGFPVIIGLNGDFLRMSLPLTGRQLEFHCLRWKKKSNFSLQSNYRKLRKMSAELFSNHRSNSKIKHQQEF